MCKLKYLSFNKNGLILCLDNDNGNAFTIITPKVPTRIYPVPGCLAAFTVTCIKTLRSETDINLLLRPRIEELGATGNLFVFFITGPALA